MNADAQFVQFLKDKADEAEYCEQNAISVYLDGLYRGRKQAFLEALKALGITYIPR